VLEVMKSMPRKGNRPRETKEIDPRARAQALFRTKPTPTPAK